MTTYLKTKKGMASLYLAAFTTLLFGIITLSFARVMLSEPIEASNSDLSQSAYDSALAGIEDAKTALVIYKLCVLSADPSTASFNGISCTQVMNGLEAGWKSGSCDVISESLDNPSVDGEKEVGGEASNQAYTCVTIANDSIDYRAMLNENNRLHVVPVLTEGTEYQNVKGIELQWHSTVADDEYTDDKFFVDKDNPDRSLVSNVYTNLYDNNILPFGPKSDATETIPSLTFDFYQTDTTFKMADLDLVNEGNSGANHGMITLYPTDTTLSNDPYASDRGKFISATNLLSVSNKTTHAAQSATTDGLTPTAVTCGYLSNYRCRATIELPSTYYGSARAKNTFFFRVTLPYGAPETDFSIRLCTAISNGQCSSYTNFVGVQSIVDSTGRASTLYRRIIARVELTSSAAIYPEYAIEVNGDENSKIEKDFWVTNNCWFTDGEGNSSTCANNGDAN